jgi:hypothetical protein
MHKRMVLLPRRRRPAVAFGAPWCLAAVLLTSCDHYAAASAPGQTPVLSPAPPSGQTLRPVACAGVATDEVSAVVETLRRSDGSCARGSEAVVYRCDPAFDPVAELGTATGIRRFLGGAYAVTVDHLPLDAHEIGVAGIGRVYVEADDARSLFVESGAGLQRWLRLPDAAGVSHPPSALLIGDSIMDGASDAIAASLPDWSLTIDAEVGRSSSGGVTIAESLVPPVPDVVVVELGVNDHDPAAFLGNAERIVSGAGGANLLLWVTAHGPESTVSVVNRAIVQTVGSDPTGAVADWDREVPLDELSSDGVHLLAGDEGAFADFLAPVLRTWRDAVDGRGPTGCQDQVRAAIAG